MVADRVIRYRAPQGNELSTYSQQTLPTRGNMRWPCFLSLIKVYLSMKRKRPREEIHFPSLPSFLFLTPQVLKFIYSFVALKETNSIEKEDKRFSPFQLLLCVWFRERSSTLIYILEASPSLQNLFIPAQTLWRFLLWSCSFLVINHFSSSWLCSPATQ